METPDFFTAVYACFKQHRVDFLITGAFAVNFHGHKRDTGALDLWVNPDAANLSRLHAALHALGYAQPPSAYLHLKHGEGILFMHKHWVVHLIPQLAMATPFAEACQRSLKTRVFGFEVQVISLEDLLNDKMKRASGPDIADVKALIQANSNKKRQ